MNKKKFPIVRYLITCLLLTVYMLCVFCDIAKVYGYEEEKGQLSLLILLAFTLIMPTPEKWKDMKGPWGKSLSSLSFSDFTLEVCLTFVKWCLFIVVVISAFYAVGLEVIGKISESRAVLVSCWGLGIILITERYIAWQKSDVALVVSDKGVQP